MDLAGAAAAGVLILIAGLFTRDERFDDGREPSLSQSGLIGAVQGFCLPFAVFRAPGRPSPPECWRAWHASRRKPSASLSAVILTPAVVAREVLRLQKAQHIGGFHLASALASRTRRSSVLLSCRTARAEVAKPLARRRPLVSLRNLLPDCVGRGFLSAPHRLLKRVFTQLSFTWDTAVPMQYPKNLDSVLLYPVYGNKRGVADNQLACSFHPTGTSEFWMLQKSLGISFNTFVAAVTPRPDYLRRRNLFDRSDYVERFAATAVSMSGSLCSRFF